MGGDNSYIIKCAIAVFCLSIFFFLLFLCNHWDDWDKTWHALLESVGDSPSPSLGYNFYKNQKPKPKIGKKFKKKVKRSK